MFWSYATEWKASKAYATRLIRVCDVKTSDILGGAWASLPPFRGMARTGTRGAVASPSTKDEVRRPRLVGRSGWREKARVRRSPTRSPQSFLSRLVERVSCQGLVRRLLFYVYMCVGCVEACYLTLRNNVALVADMRKNTVASKLGRAKGKRLKYSILPKMSG